MKKIMIIGKRGFIGNSLYLYLKKFYNVKKISFKESLKFKDKLNKFSFIINTSINKNYINKKYKENFDNDLRISKFIKNKETIYCFLSTRKIYPNKPNITEKTKTSANCNYSKNKLITEKKLKRYFKKNLLILRISNIIGNKKSIKTIHETFIDIFQKNLQNGIIYYNANAFKDFLSIDKFCQITKKIIEKKLVGVYNVSIGQKVYLENLITWLIKYNSKKFIIKKNIYKNESFYLNNKKLMSKIKIKNSLKDLKNYCYKYSKKFS